MKRFVHLMTDPALTLKMFATALIPAGIMCTQKWGKKITLRQLLRNSIRLFLPRAHVHSSIQEKEKRTRSITAVSQSEKRNLLHPIRGDRLVPRHMRLREVFTEKVRQLIICTAAYADNTTPSVLRQGVQHIRAPLCALGHEVMMHVQVPVSYESL